MKVVGFCISCFSWQADTPFPSSSPFVPLFLAKDESVKVYVDWDCLERRGEGKHHFGKRNYVLKHRIKVVIILFCPYLILVYLGAKLGVSLIGPCF